MRGSARIAVLAVLESYFPLTEDGVVEYFTAIANATTLPVVLYTNPRPKTAFSFLRPGPVTFIWNLAMTDDGFRGVFPYLESPVDDRGRVEKTVLARLVPDFINAGVHRLTGETAQYLWWRKSIITDAVELHDHLDDSMALLA